jgi:hypothetical protein
VGRWFPKYASVSTKFMVAPAYRNGLLGVRLASRVYQFGLEQGILFDFVDCNPHLERFFLGLGYCRYRTRILHPEYGEVLPLVLPVADLGHLDAVGSPWAKICREHSPHRVADQVFHQMVLSFEAAKLTRAA